MTTCLYDRRTKVIATDSKNTDDAGARWLVSKIDVLKDGSIFLGSGHLHTIAMMRQWATVNWDNSKRPDFSWYLEEPEDRAAQCLHISKDGSKVLMIDSELMTCEVLDDVVAVGSGAAYALGAMAAGADAVAAVEIACRYDGNSCPPVVTYYFKE